MNAYDHRITVGEYSVVVAVPDNIPYSSRLDILDVLTEAWDHKDEVKELKKKIAELEAAKGQLDLQDG